MVPLGPKLVLRTSWRPLAALIFTAKAWAFLIISALALTIYRELIFRFLNIY